MSKIIIYETFFYVSQISEVDNKSQPLFKETFAGIVLNCLVQPKIKAHTLITGNNRSENNSKGERNLILKIIQLYRSRYIRTPNRIQMYAKYNIQYSNEN